MQAAPLQSVCPAGSYSDQSRAISLDEPVRSRSGPFQAASGGSIPCLARLMGALRQGIGKGGGDEGGAQTVAAEGERPQGSSDWRGGGQVELMPTPSVVDAPLCGHWHGLRLP